MSLLQELNKYYSSLPKSDQITLDKYLNETGKDLGKVMYSQSEFELFRKWKQNSNKVSINRSPMIGKNIGLASKDLKELNKTIKMIQNNYKKDFNPKKVFLLKDDKLQSNYNRKSGILFVNRKDTLRYSKLKDLVMKVDGK